MQPISRDSFQSQLSASRRLDVQSAAGIRVSGNTISWPSGGWHEVQYASSGNTIREGGQSASVGPGTYNVINHTTGERFENIVVGQDTTSSFSSLESLQFSSSLDALRDSPSTTDRLGGSTSNGTTDTNNYANSGSSTVSRDLYTYVDVDCSYDTPPGVTSEGGLVEDYGPCADGPDEIVNRRVSVQYGENLPSDMAIDCAAGLAFAGATGYAAGPLAPVTVPVAAALGCAVPVAIDIAKDNPQLTVTTTRTSGGSGTTDSQSTSGGSSGGLSSGTGNQTSNNPHTA